MSDPNYAHRYHPTRKKRCGFIIGGKNPRHCGLPEDDKVHQRFKKDMPTLLDAGEALNDVIRAAQEALARYIIPDSNITDEAVVNELLGILDGEIQRVAQENWQLAKGLS